MMKNSVLAAENGVWTVMRMRRKIKSGRRLQIVRLVVSLDVAAGYITYYQYFNLNFTARCVYYYDVDIVQRSRFTHSQKIEIYV